jgi:hypothetical protein
MVSTSREWLHGVVSGHSGRLGYGKAAPHLGPFHLNSVVIRRALDTVAASPCLG